ncbi:AAA family ATPase [Agriterribacter sp.]|uniref:AAA family ATPase n=1 Tax=Agriterribacter sp. TaxID=2821509 RepID=UPI002BA643D5|nr:AAA family ATPase [Agriterribacter sp.]HRP57157.1 AAA family ATPase [Agriterribacter sp.]
MSYEILRGIGFENFRVFKQQVLFDFAKLTVLTGTNSSGKSSVINGMKLIGESFKGIRISDNLEEFELDSLFSIEINASEMMRRYGTLEKYINHTGRDKGENSFKFSIPTQLLYIKEKVVITYTIQVEENEQKTGKITGIEMKLLNRETSILKIEKHSEGYHIIVDLSAFIYTLTQAKEIQESDPKDFEIAEYLRGVSEKIKEGRFYDFSFLWAEDREDEKLFEFAMKKFYGTYNKESLKKLCTEIIDILSSKEWEEERIKYIIYSRDNFPITASKRITGLSVLDYSLRFHESRGTKNVPNSGGERVAFTHSLKSGFEKLSKPEIDNLNDKESFLEYLFKMIASKKSYYNQFWGKDSRLIEIKSFEPSEVEENFYKEFLFPNLLLVKRAFLPFVAMEAVSAERSSTKGIKSILDNDDFSRLMKNRFSATGLKKEAFNNLDRFLNKWLQEFKVADEIKFEKDKDYDIFKVKLLKDGKWMMLSDEGFGVSQVLPVILSCCPIIGWDYEYDASNPIQYNKPKLILIEEPETNLHPALQSKLADMFMDAVKTFNIRFVIETHSEYLIRKLQYLTGKGDIKPEQTVIYYFYPPREVPPGEKQVKKINIREDGMLTKDFGKGFFDESALWAFELLKLQNMN